MSRRRFYAPPEALVGETIRLSVEESHHLMRVLRLNVGDEVSVFDGCGNEYRCRYVTAQGKQALLERFATLDYAVESPLALTLVQGLAKGEKFDFIVQKATELGVMRIVPLLSDYADVKLNVQQTEKRLERWQRISLEALKQCGRRTLVDISEPLTLGEVLQNTDETALRLYFNERGGMSLQAAIADAQPDQAVLAFIGPEGGWSEAEIDLLNRHDCQAVSLGRRILRTETAAIVALALLQYALGDWSQS